MNLLYFKANYDPRTFHVLVTFAKKNKEFFYILYYVYYYRMVKKIINLFTYFKLLKFPCYLKNLFS